MKNLKKILIALMVFVLLVSSIAVMVVTAEDTNEAKLAQANTLLNAIKDSDTPETRYGAFVILSKYLDSNSIDPATDGYAEFLSAYQKKHLILAGDYYAKVNAATLLSDKVIALGKTFDLVNGYPIDELTDDPDGSGPYLSGPALMQNLHDDNMDFATAYYNTAESTKNSDINSAMAALLSLHKLVSAYPLSETADGYATLCASYNALTVEVLSSKIAPIKALKGSDNAQYITEISKNLSALVEYADICEVDVEAYPALLAGRDGAVADIDVFEVDYYRDLFDKYEQSFSDPTAENHYYASETAFSKLYSAFSLAKINSATAGYAQLYEDITAEKKSFVDRNEASKKELYAQASLSDYWFTDNLKIRDFSASSTPFTLVHADAAPKTEYEVNNSTYASMHDGIMSFFYGSIKKSPDPYFYYNDIKRMSNGVVVSYDVMLEGKNGEHFKEMTISFRNGATPVAGSTFYPICKFGYNATNDSISLSLPSNSASPDKGKSIPNIAAEGQWFNLTYTFEPDTRTGTVYVNHKPVFDIDYGPKYGETAEIWHNANFKHQVINYDNFTSYEGSSPRQVDLLSSMGVGEKFAFFVDVLYDEENVFENRNRAYMEAKMLVDTAKALYVGVTGDLSPELAKVKASVEAFESFDYDNTLLGPISAVRIAELEIIVNDILAIERNSESVETVKSAMESFDKFVEENNAFLNKKDQRYRDAVDKINLVKSDLMKVDYTIAFSKALTMFERATTLASMRKRAASVVEIYKQARYDKPENAEFMKNDKVIRDFEAIINGNLTIEDENYCTALEYYDSLVSIMAEQEKLENSYKLVDCIEFIKSIDGYEDTEAFWARHSEKIEFYIEIMRDIISVDNYDPDIAGVVSAVKSYEKINAYFYTLLQDKHIALITEQLDRFKTSSYIEKVGICTYLDKYFAENDIDLTKSELIDLEYRLSRYKAELEDQKVGYADQLAQNTQYFIATVNKMETVLTYGELKPLYLEALGYYYGMNIDSEESVIAIEKFAEFESAIELIETSSRLFKESVVLLGFTQTTSQRFEVLMQCMQYYENVDITYGSIESSVNEYLTALDEYNGQTAAVNKQIYAASDVSMACRSAEISPAILAIISGVYKR